MKSLHYTYIAFCLGALLVSPYVSQAQTSDFSPEHEFTQNCEGPSVDSEGNGLCRQLHHGRYDCADSAPE